MCKRSASVRPSIRRRGNAGGETCSAGGGSKCEVPELTGVELPVCFVTFKCGNAHTGAPVEQVQTGYLRVLPLVWRACRCRSGAEIRLQAGIAVVSQDGCSSKTHAAISL